MNLHLKYRDVHSAFIVVFGCRMEKSESTPKNRRRYTGNKGVEWKKSESTPKNRRCYTGNKGVDRKKVNLHPKPGGVTKVRRV